MSELFSQLDYLKAFPNAPKYVDFQVLALRTREIEGGKYHLALTLLDPKTRVTICKAVIYPMEWFPESTKTPSFSHYHNVLRYCYAGLASSEQPPELLLQIMKAAWKPEKDTEKKDGKEDNGQLVVLKFIISPNYNITGAELEEAFNCPAKYFYESFLGLQRTIRESPTSIGFVRGNAIHKGIQYASNEWVRSNDPVKAMLAYNRAVIDEWRDNFDVLLRKSYIRGPPKDLKLPLQVESIVVDQIIVQFKGVNANQLLNECLLFSPERGISGRADQIILRKEYDELWEIKTGSRYFIESDYDLFTGTTHPGGIQAFAYHDVITKVTGNAPKTFIEFFDADAELAEDNPIIIPLQEHAILKRRKINLVDEDKDRYLNLLLQTRNIAFAIESGLLSGFDRYKIHRFLSRRFMPTLGTDFNLLSSNWMRICNYCPSNQHGICADGPRLIDSDIWLHFPMALFEYWSWYFKQLRVELNNIKRHLHTLATTEVEALENKGVTISNLLKVNFDSYKYILTLKSKKKIFTRIREGDDVFVTPANLKPGEIFSVEGKVQSLGSNELIIKTRSILKGRSDEIEIFRVDQVENVLFSEWQSRSLTDFLFESMERSGIQGRKIDDNDLPYTTKLLFGLAKPRKINPVKRSRLINQLDKFKVSAIEKALGLECGDILLVQGPPGSGKTKLIAQMAKEIFSDYYLLRSKMIDETANPMAKPVLILANTHRAADEVIVKLSSYKELTPYIIRLESYSKEHSEEVKKFILPVRVGYDEIMVEKADANKLVSILNQGINIYHMAGIIVGTLGSVGNNLLKGLNFHYIIVDEAGQATEPATLGAFRHLCPPIESKERFPRVVLVGDHMQLPPVVAEETTEQTPEVPQVLLNAGLTKEDTLRTSLFERLYRFWEGRFDNVIILSEQYRMNEAISRIIKNAFYPKVNYVPANATIGSHTLDKFLNFFKQIEGTQPYSKLMLQIFDPTKPVIFINTELDDDALEGIEDVDIQIESRFNIREAQLVAKIISALLVVYPKDLQFDISKQIGIISPYRHQNNLIFSELRTSGIDEEIITNIRVDTVDRFQGDEREIIVISLTNSNEAHVIGQLHRDWRRMNVSISRAKAKLILVGNKQTFTSPSSEPKEEDAKMRFKEVFKTIEELVQEKKALEINSKKIEVEKKGI